MERELKAEVEDFHAILSRWFTGALPRTPEAYEGLSAVISKQFRIVSPTGSITEHDAMVAGLEKTYGMHAGEDKAFSMRIENCRLIAAAGDLVVGTYEEWQQLSGNTTARLSTVVFRRNPEMRHGLEWLHLHETWIPGHERKDG